MAADKLRDRIADLKRQVNRAARTVRRAAANAGRGSARASNVAGRTNAVVVANVGSDRSAQTAESRQHVVIRQRRGETSEASVTSRTTSRS